MFTLCCEMGSTIPYRITYELLTKMNYALLLQKLVLNIANILVEAMPNTVAVPVEHLVGRKERINNEVNFGVRRDT